MGDPQFGLHQVWPRPTDPANTPPDTTVDIVAIHGLDTYSPRTWVAFAKEGDSSSHQVNWLQDEDMLPSRIPTARIYTYNWNSRTSKDASCEHLGSHVMSFLFDLSCRRDSKKRPLIFIASCYGGVLLAKALNFASMAHNRYRHILDTTIGIVFLGTPFRGSNKLALTGAQLRVLLAGTFGAEISARLMRELEIENGVLEELVEIFARLVLSKNHAIPVTCFYETRETDISKAIPNLPGWIRSILSTQTSVILVGEESACLQGVERLALATNHAMLNKYRGPNDQNFIRVSNWLQEFLDIWEKKGLEQVVNSNNMEPKLPPTTELLNIDSVHPSGRKSPRGDSMPLDKNVHWVVSRKVKSTFTGRKEDVDRLEKACLRSLISMPIQYEAFVVTGVGGIGKSEVCLKVADRLRSRFWGVFWVDVGNTKSAEEGFLRVARKISGHSRKSLDDALGVLSRCSKPWLLILDNAENPDVFCSNSFSSWPHATILMTSRSPTCEKHNTIGHFRLQCMAENDAMELFYKSAEIPGSQRQQLEHFVRTIVVDNLRCYTLAVILAGAHIKAGFSTLPDYLKILQEDHANDQQIEALAFSLGSEEAGHRYIWSSFEASIKVLGLINRSHAQDALCLLGILAMIDSSPISMDIFEVAWDRRFSRFLESAESPTDFHIEAFSLTEWHYDQLPDFLMTEDSQFDSSRITGAVDLLQSLSLIQRDKDNRINVASLSTHPVIHSWAWARQKPEDQQLNWIRAATVVVLLSEDDAHTSFKSQLPTHLQALTEKQKLIEFRDMPSLEIARLLFSCYGALKRYPKLKPCTGLLDRIFSVMGISPKIPSVPYVDLYLEEARCLGEDTGTGGQESAALLEKLAYACESELPESSATRLRVQHELASVYLHNNQLSKSIKLFQHVVKTRERVLGESSPEYILSEQRLAEAYRTNGQTKEALELDQNADLRGKILNESHPEYLALQFQRAMNLLDSRRPDKAIEVFRHVEKLHAERVAVNDRKHLNVKRHLSVAYMANGEIKEAIKLLLQVIEIYETAGEEKDFYCQWSRYELARAYLDDGQLEEGITLLRQHLKIQKEMARKNSPQTLSSQFMLGQAYRTTGRLKEAIRYIELAVRGREEISKEDPRLPKLQAELALTYLANGERDKGMELLQNVVKRQEDKLHLSDPRLLALQSALARAYNENGQVAEGYRLFQHIQKIQEQTLGEIHPPGKSKSDLVLTNVGKKPGDSTGD